MDVNHIFSHSMQYLFNGLINDVVIITDIEVVYGLNNIEFP